MMKSLLSVGGVCVLSFLFMTMTHLMGVVVLMVLRFWWSSSK